MSIKLMCKFLILSPFPILEKSPFISSVSGFPATKSALPYTSKTTDYSSNFFVWFVHNMQHTV